MQPVHDMTTRAWPIGERATGLLARCPECGYGTVRRAGAAAILVHAASCPSEEADCVRAAGGYLACDWTGCKAVLDPARVSGYGAKTCNSKHRAAAWKQREGYGRRANGTPRPRKRSGLQVSHKRAVVAFSGFLQRELGWDAEESEQTAERVLRPALSERQRTQLEARDSE